MLHSKTLLKNQQPNNKSSGMASCGPSEDKTLKSFCMPRRVVKSWEGHKRPQACADNVTQAVARVVWSAGQAVHMRCQLLLLTLMLAVRTQLP